MTLREQVKALRDNIALVDMELDKNKRLSVMWSNVDREPLAKLDSARNDLNLVLVDLIQQLTDAENAQRDVLREFERMV